MNAKRLTIGALVGGITLWATGFIIFEVVFASFAAANAGSATGVAREATVLWALGVGNRNWPL
jgi:hypothetical protein